MATSQTDQGPREAATDKRAAEDAKRGITPDLRKVLDDPKAKAQLQLSGDLPAGEKAMSKAELEKALERKLERHELRWVRR